MASGVTPLDSFNSKKSQEVRSFPPAQKDLVRTRKIIEQFGKQVGETLHSQVKMALEEHQFTVATKLVYSSRGVPQELREKALGEIRQYVKKLKKEDRVDEKAQLENLSAQLAFEKIMTPLIEDAYTKLEEVSEQTTKLQAGYGEVYLDRLVGLASQLDTLELELRFDRYDEKSNGKVDKNELQKEVKHLREEFMEESRDLIHALDGELKHAKTEYHTALEAWNKEEGSKNPEVQFSAFIRLEEACSHIEKIATMSEQAELLGDVGKEINRKLDAFKEFETVAESRSLLRTDLVERMDTCTPDEIRTYVKNKVSNYNEAQKQDHNKAFIAFKRAMRPFFVGMAPLLPEQRAAFDGAKKEATDELVKYEKVPSANYNYIEKYDPEMRTAYFDDRMTDVERKKLQELTSPDADDKISKKGLFFLAMQAVAMLRGADALLGGKDAAALNVRAVQLHKQVLDPMEPRFRERVEKTVPVGAVVQLAEDIILDSAVQDAKATQSLESESLLFRAEHSQKVKAAPNKSDYGSRDCVGLASSTAKSSIIGNQANTVVASAQEYGNKHKNLVELHNLVDSIKMEGVEVPMPYGLKSSDVHDFISKASPSVFKNWETLGKLYGTRPEGEEGKSFLDRADVADLVKKIRESILEAFEGDKPLTFGKEFEKWLKPIIERGSYLMVRSTGDEDSSYANAGGNVSENYVSTATEDIRRAAGKVVASYFSIPSLANRLNARANPFESELKLAVTMQELIGEPLGATQDPKAVPVSLVLFTNEPNLGGDKSFRIMRIGASYGHGEAVVGNQGIATDSYFIMQSRLDPEEIHWRSDIRQKPERLAPVRGFDGKPTLEKVANSEELQKKPALNENMLRRLFQLGKHVEARYAGEPTDMEIVIVGDKIYPVQARPVNRPVNKPFYVDPEKVPAAAVVKELQGNHQVSGKGEAIVIRNPEELLIAETLGEAESKFQLGKHRVIINRQREPEASHYVVNFAGMGIPALQFDDIAPVQQAQKAVTSGTALVIDIQDASIKIWKESVGKPEDALTQGYLNFPGHVAISLNIADLPPELKGREIPQTIELKELVRSIKLAKTSQLALGKIKELCEHPVINALESKVNELEEKIQKSESKSLRARVAVQAINALDQRIKSVCLQAAHMPQEEGAEINRMEIRQYTAEFEAMLFSESSNSLGAFSAIMLDPLTDQAEMILNYEFEEGKEVRFQDLLADGREAPLPVTRERWRKALKILEMAGPELQADVNKFLKLASFFRQAGAIENWLTIALKEEIPASPKELLDKLLTGLDSSTMNMLSDLVSMKSHIRERRGDLAAFGDPATFDSAWQRLQRAVDTFRDEKLLVSLKKGFSGQCLPVTLLGQELLIELVDVFDRSIKSMKASTLYPNDAKIAHFKEMIGSYLQLLEVLVNKLETSNDVTRDCNEYMKEFKSCYNKAPLNTQSLGPSAGFEVPPALITAATLFSRHYPMHLEDIFTLVHQNLLEVITLQSKEVIDSGVVASLDVPDIFKDTIGKLKDLGQVQFLGLVLDGSKLIAKYNLPIRQHSSTFQLIYDVAANKSFFHFQFLGGAFTDRWAKVKHRLIVLDILEKIHLRTEPVLTPNGLDFECLLDDSTIQQIFSSTRAMVEYSLTMKETILEKDGMGNSRTLDDMLVDEQYDKLASYMQRSSKSIALDLFGILVDKEQCYDEAIALAVASANEDEDSEVGSNVLKLFAKLLQKNKGYDEALAMAKAQIERGANLDTKIIRIIGEKNGYDDLFTIAKAYLKNPDPTVRVHALSFIRGLYNRYILADRDDIDEATAATKQALQDVDPTVRERAQELFFILRGSRTTIKKEDLDSFEIMARNDEGLFEKNIRRDFFAFCDILEKLKDCSIDERKELQHLIEVSWKISLRNAEMHIGDPKSNSRILEDYEKVRNSIKPYLERGIEKIRNLFQSIWK